MDNEDRDHFKTIASQSVGQPIGSLRQPIGESSKSGHDQASCLLRAKAIFGCYRRDEAHDPEIFTASLAAILADYPKSIVDYAADPRTGVNTEFPMGLPNVGQIRQFLDATTRRMELLAQPVRKAVPFTPPPKLPGQIDANEFAALVAAGKTPKAVISRFAAPVAPAREGQSEAERAITTELIIEANRRFWEAECRAGGLAPSTSTASPSLLKAIGAAR